MRRAVPELVFAALLGAFGLFMAVRSLGYGLLVDGGLIGPGFVPFVAGVLLAGFAAWAGVETALRASGGRSEARVVAAQAAGSSRPHDDRATGPYPERDSGPRAGADGERAGEDGEREAMPGAGERSVSNSRAMLVLGLVVAATLLTYVIGYVVAFGIIVFVILAVVERERVWLATVISVAAIFVAWFVFAELLGVPLPGGALHILGGG